MGSGEERGPRDQVDVNEVSMSESGCGLGVEGSRQVWGGRLSLISVDSVVRMDLSRGAPVVEVTTQKVRAGWTGAGC